MRDKGGAGDDDKEIKQRKGISNNIDIT